MRKRVRLWPQVQDYLRSVAPAPRRALRAALHDLERGKGETRSLEGKLAGFSRLRVGAYRVVFRERFERGQAIVDCVYAEERSVVYELFSAHLVLNPEAFTAPP